MIFPHPPQNQQCVFRFDPAEQQIKDLQTELLQSKEAAQAMENRIDRMKKEATHLRQHFSHHKQTLHQAQKLYSEETARLYAASEDKLKIVAKENKNFKNRIDSLQFKASRNADQMANVEKVIAELEAQLKKSDLVRNDSQAILQKHWQLLMSINERQKKQTAEIYEQRNGLDENSSKVNALKDTLEDKLRTASKENQVLRHKLQTVADHIKVNQQQTALYSDDLQSIREALRILHEKIDANEKAGKENNQELQKQIQEIRQESTKSGQDLKRMKEEKKEEQKKYRADKLLADQNYQQILNRVNSKETGIYDEIEKLVFAKETIADHVTRVDEQIKKLQEAAENTNQNILDHDQKFNTLQATFKDMLSAMEQKIGRWVMNQNFYKNK